MEEFEIKFLEVNVPELEEKLKAIGAEKVGEYNYRRMVFDYPDFRLDKNHGWIRVRTDGSETTLTYKERVGVKSHDAGIPDEGMKEVEVLVNSYENVCAILKSIGLVIKQEAMNRRIRYKKDDVEFDIDFWAQLPPYVEIESVSMQKVKNAARELGFKPEDGLVCSVKQVYKKYGINLDDYSFISPEKMVKK